MKKHFNDQWYVDYLADMLAKYGDFPPPWIYIENSHPYSMEWRVGSGESYIIAFGEWWEQQDKSFDQRINYFRKWPAPPRWCGWMAEVIWDLEPWESDDEFDYSTYFAKLKNLGFQGTDDYESDLNDDKWV